MTLNEIIYDIREKLKLHSDDIDITDEYLAHLVNIKRNLLLKQRYGKFIKTVPEESKQIICVALEEVNAIDGEECMGTVLRSVNKIPTLLQLDNKPALIGVRTLDIRALPINVISIERFPYLGYNKWLSNQVFVALDSDSKIYFTSKNIQHKFLENVKIIAVFEDPEDADGASCETDDDCEYYDKNYSIEPQMVHDVVNLIFKELAPGLNIPDDKLNNADESPR